MAAAKKEPANWLVPFGLSKLFYLAAFVFLTLAAFGFNVIEINGHDFDEIAAAFAAAKACTDKPTAIIMKTVKGRGVSFMENQVGWHGKGPNAEEHAQAMQELRATLAAIEEG